MQQTYTFHVSGMHCASCVLMTESELKDLPSVSRATTSLKKHSVEVVGDFGDKTPAAIAEELSIPLLKHGYALSLEKKAVAKSWSDFKAAIPIALLFAAVFLGLQKLGLVNLI